MSSKQTVIQVITRARMEIENSYPYHKTICDTCLKEEVKTMLQIIIWKNSNSCCLLLPEREKIDKTMSYNKLLNFGKATRIQFLTNCIEMFEVYPKEEIELCDWRRIFQAAYEETKIELPKIFQNLQKE